MFECIYMQISVSLNEDTKPLPLLPEKKAYSNIPRERKDFSLKVPRQMDNTSRDWCTGCLDRQIPVHTHTHKDRSETHTNVGWWNDTHRDICCLGKCILLRSIPMNKTHFSRYFAVLFRVQVRDHIFKGFPQEKNFLVPSGYLISPSYFLISAVSQTEAWIPVLYKCC